MGSRMKSRNLRISMATVLIAATPKKGSSTIDATCIECKSCIKVAQLWSRVCENGKIVIVVNLVSS